MKKPAEMNIDELKKEIMRLDDEMAADEWPLAKQRRLRNQRDLLFKTLWERQ